MESILEWLLSGIGPLDLALFLQRCIVGAMFVLYRFRWVYDPSSSTPWFCPYRHGRLRTRLYSCGYSPHLAPFVAILEILAGLALLLGLLTIPAAFGLFVVLLFGQACLLPEELPKMQPVDKLDYLRAALLWPEPIYTVLLLNVMLTGPGRWSLDYVVMQWLQGR